MGEAKRKQLAAQKEVERQDELIRQAFQQTSLCIDQYPGNPIQALLSTYAGRNMTMDLADSVLDKSNVSCSAGCSACCHQMVLCSPFEVLNIAKMILDTWQVEALDDLDTKLNALSDLPLTPEARYGKNTPCPLLKNGRCTVYEQRPMPCRALYSNSRRHCESCLIDGGGDVGFLADPQITSTVMTMGINAALKSKLNLNVDMVELSGALHTALLDFENVAEQWFTGQNPFVKHQVESDQPAMSEIVEVLINRLELS